MTDTFACDCAAGASDHTLVLHEATQKQQRPTSSLSSSQQAKYNERIPVRASAVCVFVLLVLITHTHTAHCCQLSLFLLLLFALLKIFYSHSWGWSFLGEIKNSARARWMELSKLNAWPNLQEWRLLSIDSRLLQVNCNPFECVHDVVQKLAPVFFTYNFSHTTFFPFIRKK